MHKYIILDRMWYYFQVLNKVIADDSLHFTNELYRVLCTVIRHNIKYKLIAKNIQITEVLNIMPYGTLMPRALWFRISHQNVCGLNCPLQGPINVGCRKLPSCCSVLYLPYIFILSYILVLYSHNSRLRSYEKFPRSYTRTKRYCSFVQYALSHYQDRLYND